MKKGTGKSTLYIRARQAFSRSRQSYRGNNQDTPGNYFTTPEGKAELKEYEAFAESLGRKYKTGLKEADRKRRRRITGLAGAAVGAGIYAGALHKTVKGWTNTIYNDAIALKDLVETASSLSPNSNRAQIRNYLKNHEALANSVGESLKEYEKSISSLSNTLRDVRTIAEDIGRISANAPGYNTQAIQDLTNIRNKIVQKMSELVTGRDQSVRISEEYKANFNRLNALLTKAVAEKKITNEKVSDILNSVDSLSDSGEEMLEGQKEELRRLSERYNTYNQLIEDFQNLPESEIKSNGQRYQELIRAAEKNDLKIPQYHDIGSMVSIGTGLLAAYVFGKTSARWLSWLVPRKKFDPRKEARMHLEKRQRDLEARAEEEPWNGPIIIILFISLLFLSLSFNTNPTGFIVSESSSSNLANSLIYIICSLTIFIIIFTKVYNSKKSNKIKKK